MVRSFRRSGSSCRSSPIGKGRSLGEHVVGATPTGTFCGGGTSEAAVVIRPESQKILRIASGQSGDIHLQPSAF